VQPSVITGPSYVVPPGYDRLVSWSTNAAPGDGQMLKMKVFRRVDAGGPTANPQTWMAVGYDGPRPLMPGALNTFPVDLHVQPGDVLGLNDVNASSAANACTFAASENHFEGGTLGDLPDGQSGSFNAVSGDGLNISAVVGVTPSSVFSFGNVKDNKNKGTATLAVNVPGPGDLSLTGAGVKTQRAGGGAAASKTVTAAGTVKLLVKPKGKVKKKLKQKGKAKVKVTVTYTPHGDIVGDPNTQTDKVKLIKKH
jgi:hypothetical protein